MEGVNGLRLDAGDGLPARIIKVHSLRKKHYVGRFAETVGTAMSKKASERWWVEGFAGPGRLYLPDEDQFYDGSPLDALGVRKPFTGYIFNDFSAQNAEALRRRVAGHSNTHVFNDDANSRSFIEEVIRLVPRHAYLVLYLDPEGLELDFATIDQFAAAFDRIDFLLNFPVRGVIRYLRAGHLTRARKVLDLRDPERLVGVNGEWGENVRRAFDDHLDLLDLCERTRRNIRSDGKNSPLYDLLLASRHPLARELFDRASAIEPDGQRQLFAG
jgi:three-Cys-motif partner protein